MSTVFRVQKNANYTTMSNYHLKDKRLSYKAKGLLSVILSLPDEWDYSLKGLAYISGDGIDSVRGGIKELESYGYISRGSQTRDERGRMSANEYFVYENPEQNPFFNPEEENGSAKPNSTALENPTRSNSEVSAALENPMRSSSNVSTALDFPMTEKPLTDNPTTENPTAGTLLNNKILTNQLLNNQSIPQSSPADEIDRTDFYKKPPNFSFSELKEKNIVDERGYYREIIHKNIDYDYYRDSSDADLKKIDEMVRIMLDVICTKRGTVRANGGEIPCENVKDRFLEINSDHIDYVLEALKKSAPDIKNIRAYLITALYNAPATMDSYYSAMVNHDMYGS